MLGVHTYVLDILCEHSILFFSSHVRTFYIYAHLLVVPSSFFFVYTHRLTFTYSHTQTHTIHFYKLNTHTLPFLFVLSFYIHIPILYILIIIVVIDYLFLFRRSSFFCCCYKYTFIRERANARPRRLVIIFHLYSFFARARTNVYMNCFLAIDIYDCI